MANRLHPDIEMGEVKLKIGNLERSVGFYEEVLGFKVLGRTRTTAELGAADGRKLLMLEQIPDAVLMPANRTAGLYHYAVLLPSRQDLGLALQRMIDAGIEIGQADHAVSEALYISDPDGNGIEIYRDRPRGEWTYEADGSLHMVTEQIDWRGLLKEAEGREWQGLPAGTRIGHVHLHVSDLEASREFYVERLGFDIMVDGARFMGALFVAAGGYHHHLGLNVWAGKGAPRRPQHATGLAYYTILFPDEAALLTTVEQLRQCAVELEERENAWFTEDPSGNRIKLSVATIA